MIEFLNRESYLFILCSFLDHSKMGTNLIANVNFDSYVCFMVSEVYVMLHYN